MPEITGPAAANLLAYPPPPFRRTAERLTPALHHARVAKKTLTNKQAHELVDLTVSVDDNTHAALCCV